MAVVQNITTLAEARRQVVDNRTDGVVCPCCDQLCKVYRRSIYAQMGKFLIWLVKECEKRDPGEWVDILEGPAQRGGDFAKMAYWGLIEQQENQRTSTRTTRYWRATPAGIDFARGRVTIRKHANVYNGKLLELSGDDITIFDVLGSKFDYAELMNS